MEITKFSTETARYYLAGLFSREIKDNTFTKYIMEKLAGDFACKIAGYIAAMDVEEEQKPAVDEQKRRMAEEILEAAIDSSTEYNGGKTYFFCVYCSGEKATKAGEFKHDKHCITIETYEYLESLEGE